MAWYGTAFGDRSAAFLRSKSGRIFLILAMLLALLSAGVGYGFYVSNLSWFLRNKGEEKVTAMELVDAFVSEYANARATFLNGDAPVPATYRAHAIDRFNKTRLTGELLHMRLVGPPGREIVTAAPDTITADAIRRFSGKPNPQPETDFVTVGGEMLLRTIYPSLASQQNCIDCHNKMQAGMPPWHLNDVMGAFVVDAPAGAFFRRNVVNSIGIGVMVFFMSLGIGLYISLLHFRQVVASETARQRILQSEARFKDYAETASDWYWETGPDHRFNYISERIRAFGGDPARRLGKSRVELGGDTSPAADIWKAHVEALERREPFRDFTYLRRLQDEPPRHISTSGKPFFDEQGRFCGYRGTARDVTESVEAAERLSESMVVAERANRAKSDFLANMSHELRTPLNAVIGFSELLRKETFGPLGHASYREYAGDIHDSGIHLLNIINDILDLAKIEAGKFDLQQEPVDLLEIIDTTLRVLRPKANAAAHQISVSIPDRVCGMCVDRRAMKQILLNLIGNAVKFTPSGGRVGIVARETEYGGVAVAISDTGIGIADHDLEKVLTPFGQVETSYSRRHEGTGLGLSLTKRLVELHGGRLDIASEVNVGTTVTVTLPAACRVQQLLAAE
ncbi:MAG TPA: ATP-binding protein [Candidatus Cybelea sp.]|nr:ATP-binding protein [Candidatus Cybelea sp.]